MSLNSYSLFKEYEQQFQSSIKVKRLSRISLYCKCDFDFDCSSKKSAFNLINKINLNLLKFLAFQIINNYALKLKIIFEN